jgi:hypothetical protein
MFLGSSKLLGARRLWKIRVSGEHKFFEWLVLMDRFWMVERQHRHGLQDDDQCTLCDQGSETISHLLLGCVYIREVWTAFLLRFGWEARAPTPEAPFSEWWLAARKLVIKRRRKAFDSVVLLVARGIWLQHNCYVFDPRSLPPALLVEQL